MRSSERARELGEVFTPENIVNDILDLLQDVNYSSRFLEPGCGNGNFLVEIISRKMELVKDLPEVARSVKIGNLIEFEFKALISLASIYAVDIDELNIKESRERLGLKFRELFKKYSKKEISEEYLNSVNYILEKNIIYGDLIEKPDLIEIYEFSELPNYRIKQQIFRYSDLIFPEDEVFEDNDMLFGHVPIAKRDLPAIDFKKLGVKND